MFTSLLFRKRKSGIMSKVFVHPRVHERHPEIDSQDALYAWTHAIVGRQRLDEQVETHIVVGIDAKSRLMEMVGMRNDSGDWLVYHALVPPTKKVLTELGL